MASNISNEFVEVGIITDSIGAISQEFVEVFQVTENRGYESQFFVEVFMVPGVTVGTSGQSGYIQGVRIARQSSIVGRRINPKNDLKYK